tara:strand:- start:1464 stop:2228 length:765 start_codon:yes stop_codon:yes gene_type:complete
LRRVRKKTDKVVDELIALRDSRKSIDDFFFSHQLNFYESCSLMHSFITSDCEKRKLLEIAYRQYYVCLVSCWETFFRDVFVYVHSKDESLTSRLMESMKPAIDTFEDDEIDLPELLSKSFNFQNINDLEEAYDKVWGTSFLKYICSTDIGPCGINGKVAGGLVMDKLIDDWYDVILKTFSIRHKVVHDANFRPEVDFEFIQKSETVFLLIPQIATHFIAEKFSLKRIALSNGVDSVPYIFTVSELLTDDWQVVE